MPWARSAAERGGRGRGRSEGSSDKEEEEAVLVRVYKNASSQIKEERWLGLTLNRGQKGW